MRFIDDYGWPTPCLMIVEILLSASRPASADTLRIDARALFAKSVTESVRLSDDTKAIELAQGEPFEDDGPAAGYSYKPNEEKLSATTWIKKDFLVPDAHATKATLLVGPGAFCAGSSMESWSSFKAEERHDGQKRLEIRPQNTVGREGVASRLVLDFQK